MNIFKFKELYVYNRYNYKYPPDNWTIFGIQSHWYDHWEKEYRLCLFGFELRIVLSRLK